MKEKIKALIKKYDKPFTRYIIVGATNTLVGTAIMFIAYNVIGLGYWPSSAANYILASILSFFLNKHFTFQSKATGPREVISFIINIAVCYGLAYGIAQPLARKILGSAGASKSLVDNFSMVLGMGLYVILNYFGQRIFVFKKDE